LQDLAKLRKNFSQFRYADPREPAWLARRGEQPVIRAPDTYARDDFSSRSAADQVLDIQSQWQSQPRRARSRVRDHRAAAYFLDCTHTTSPTTAVAPSSTTSQQLRWLGHTHGHASKTRRPTSHLLRQGQCPHRPPTHPPGVRCMAPTTSLPR
jgi:hypothetical protein